MTDFTFVRSLREQLTEGRTTSRLLVERFAERIDAENARWHCYRETTLDAARRAADVFDRDGAVAANALGGIPVGVKDVFSLDGVPARSGSAAESCPDAPESGLSRHLRAAGTPVLGLQTCHEFAFGPVGDVSFPDAAVNPRDPTLVPGGSSSGSAVAVATGLAPMSFGSDTGGSIRTPAAFNGLVGFMPARNDVDPGGMNHLSPSLDRIGPIAADVDSAHLGWRSLAGDADVPRLPDADIADFRIGMLSGPSFEELDDIVARGYDAFLGRIGAVAAPRSLRIDASPGQEAQGTLVAADAWRLYGVRAQNPRSGIGAEVATRILEGAAVGDEGCARARQRAHDFDVALQRCFDEAELLICPTTPIAIPRVGERERRRADGTTEPVYRAVTRHTSPFNVATVCALTVPYDLTSPNPLAVQIVARPGDEDRAFALAATIERKYRK